MAGPLLLGVTALMAAMTFLPLVPIAHGFIRVCDFPRLQILGIAVVLSALTIVLLPTSWGTLLLLGTQGSVIAVQLAICLRFTPLWRVQSLPSDRTSDHPLTVRVLAANVKMSNREYSRVVQLVRERDPHIAAFIETDDQWLQALGPLKERLPFSVELPQDNAYGLLLLSRLPLRAPQVRYLVLDQVPSIRVAVELPDGRSFRLYVVHPEPPVPFEDTLGRDGELILTAYEAKSDPLPAIVTGDLNDVAWSRTTRRFQRLSGLLDPRVGRGFYNTFDARIPLLRWPLDHLFHDPRFRLIAIERLPDIGSDHFPMLFELSLENDNAAGESPGQPDRAEVREAEEVLDKAAELDRKPIGTDWEG
ncbi:MAG TPA: endonuclease/exonuclease/phosphatase family protein [Bauldia sp.]|nr:endonuclease/exonuclease/phosphatase family protein [Bauldia sp.]